MPDGFVPGSEWQKPEHWGAAPFGWVFYTRNGQPASAPAAAWQPGPDDFAARLVGRGSAEQPAWDTSGLAPDSQSSRTAETAGDKRKRPLVLIVAAGVVLLVLVGVGVHLYRVPAATAAAAPLSHQQLMGALNPAKGKTVAGLELTGIDELTTTDVFKGVVCQDLVVGFFSGADGPVVEARDSGGGIDPASQTIVPGGLTVDAAVYSSTGEAQAVYSSASQAAVECFVDRASGVRGPTGEKYCSITGSYTYVFMTHRNVLALLRFASQADIQKGVDDVDKFLNDAR